MSSVVQLVYRQPPKQQIITVLKSYRPYLWEIFLNNFFCMAELPFVVLVSPRMSSGPQITFWVSVSVPQIRVRQGGSSPSETVLFQGSHTSANTRLASTCMQSICFAWFCCVSFALWSCYYFCREAEVPFPAVEFPPWQTGSFEELVPFI